LSGEQNPKFAIQMDDIHKESLVYECPVTGITNRIVFGYVDDDPTVALLIEAGTDVVVAGASVPPIYLPLSAISEAVMGGWGEQECDTCMDEGEEIH